MRKCVTVSYLPMQCVDVIQPLQSIAWENSSCSKCYSHHKLSDQKQCSLVKEISKEDITAIGEQFIAKWYILNTDSGVNVQRCKYFMSPKYVPIEKMPPTSRAFYFHPLRVHHQVST